MRVALIFVLLIVLVGTVAFGVNEFEPVHTINQYVMYEQKSVEQAVVVVDMTAIDTPDITTVINENEPAQYNFTSGEFEDIANHGGVADRLIFPHPSDRKLYLIVS